MNLWNTYTVFMNVEVGLAREIAFADLAAKKALTMLVIYEMQVWMGDAILVWRLWLVSNKNLKIVAAPALTCTGLLVCSCGFLKACSVSKLTDPASLQLVRNWCIAAFSVSLFENLFCSSMIVWQMYRSQHDVRHLTQSNLTSIMRIFIECAGLWIVVVIITFVTYLVNNYVYFIFYYMANPILGVSFCLMIVRLNLRTRKSTSGQYANNSSSGASGISGNSRAITAPRKVAFDPLDEDSSEQIHDPSKIRLSPLRHGDKLWNQGSSGEV
jgi:hypothetical protein